MGGPIVCVEVKTNIDNILQRAFCYVHDIVNIVHKCFKIINS